MFTAFTDLGIIHISKRNAPSIEIMVPELPRRNDKKNRIHNTFLVYRLLPVILFNLSWNRSARIQYLIISIARCRFSTLYYRWLFVTFIGRVRFLWPEMKLISKDARILGIPKKLSPASRILTGTFRRNFSEFF